MAFATSQTASQPISFLDSVPAAIAAFNRLTVDDKLGLLWVVYENMGSMVTPAATGAARLQFAQGLLDQVVVLNPTEQLNFMRDLVNRVNTPMTRAYGVLTNNTKLAFWYQLAEMMRSGDVIAVPQGYRLSANASGVYNRMLAMEFGQQITFLRKAAINMGCDPFS